MLYASELCGVAGQAARVINSRSAVIRIKNEFGEELSDCPSFGVIDLGGFEHLGDFTPVDNAGTHSS